MVDEVAASLHYVVTVATMYTNVCELHLLRRSLLPSGTRATQVIAMQNIDVNIHTAHCAAFALHGIPAVI